MKNVTLKQKILNKIGLTTLKERDLELADVVRKHVERENKKDFERNQQIFDIEEEYKKQIQLKEKNQKDLEEKIKTLKSENTKLNKSNDSLSEENRLLKNEINMLNEEMSGMVKYTVLKPSRPRKTQTMKVSSRNTVRSKIARESAKEVE